ncbi:MAG: hypothetical protein ABIJ16_05605 [Bacteroidota bacterium]
MRAFIVVMAFSFFLLPALIGQTIDVSGHIASNTTWSADTVHLTGDVIIDSSFVLTVSPGVYVEAQGYYAIYVKGTILAEGTQNDSIIFSVADTTGFSNISIYAGGWGGIRFDSTSSVNDTSRFKYCRIEFGKAIYEGGPYGEGSGGGMRIMNFSKVVINHCTICDNLCYGNGGGIICIHGSPVITENLFKNNYGMAHGGGICTHYDSVRITGNVFIHNLTDG